MAENLRFRRTIKASNKSAAPYRRTIRSTVSWSIGDEPRARTRSLLAAGMFAGIGGIERGLGEAGHPTALLCEIDPAALAVLDEHFPTVAKHRDVRSLRNIDKNVELLTAGFPCQDLSQAGMTAGIDGARSGLVNEVFRLLERRKIPWVLLENVPFMLRLGGGRALEVIVTALERLGYRWAYRIVDAMAFGLPQRRQRVYLVASRESDPRGVLFSDEAAPIQRAGSYRDFACGFYWTEGLRGLGWAIDAIPPLKGGSSVGVASPPAILLVDGRVVTPSLQVAEVLQGFPKDWTAPAEVVGRPALRWRLIGNAVNVRVAHWIGTRLANLGSPILRNLVPLTSNNPWPNAAFNVGDGRYGNDLSTWPMAVDREPLERFFNGGLSSRLLSRRATAGFFERAQRAKLRFPAGFLKAIESHLNRMRE